VTRLPAPLRRSWYARPSPLVARDLLGRLLVRILDGSVLAGRIVECEAYQEDDPASHSYRGRTARTAVMFGPPGHLYVYFSYGNHHCCNVVTGQDGEGSAVLLRAVEPVRGIEVMMRRRATDRPTALCSGPGRLTQAYGIGMAQNGADLVEGSGMYIARGKPLPDERVAVSPRIGISQAPEKAWRFFEAGSPFVSKPPSGWPGRARGAPA
jgi:DNA-3-methyladenine glycosylase